MQARGISTFVKLETRGEVELQMFQLNYKQSMLTLLKPIMHSHTGK